MNLFTKSYEKDLPWLRLAVMSISKKCKDPVNWTIVVDDGCEDKCLATVNEVTIGKYNRPIFHVIPVSHHWRECVGMEGYMAQQWIKLTSHRCMKSGNYWNWDSDVIALKNFTESDFMGKSGRPIYFFTPFNSMMDGADRSVHQLRRSLIQQVFGLPEISFEWMRCFPICMYSEICRIGQERKEWKEAFNLCKTNNRGFSEFNLYGQFANMFFPDAYEWKNTMNCETWQGSWNDEKKITCQNWSWGGIGDNLKEFVEKMT